MLRSDGFLELLAGDEIGSAGADILAPVVCCLTHNMAKGDVVTKLLKKHLSQSRWSEVRKAYP